MPEWPVLRFRQIRWSSSHRRWSGIPFLGRAEGGGLSSAQGPVRRAGPLFRFLPASPSWRRWRAKLEAEFRDVQDFDSREGPVVCCRRARTRDSVGGAPHRGGYVAHRSDRTRGSAATACRYRSCGDWPRSHFTEAAAGGAGAGRRRWAGAKAAPWPTMRLRPSGSRCQGQPGCWCGPTPSADRHIPAPKNTAYWSGGGTRSNPDEWLTSDTLPSHTAASCGAY